MTTAINIQSINCVSCGLPNGEAETRPGEPCVHCRVGVRAKDVPRRDAEMQSAVVDGSKGEGEERSIWRFKKQGRVTSDEGSVLRRVWRRICGGKPSSLSPRP